MVIELKEFLNESDIFLKKFKILNRTLSNASNAYK